MCRYSCLSRNRDGVGSIYSDAAVNRAEPTMFRVTRLTTCLLAWVEEGGRAYSSPVGSITTLHYEPDSNVLNDK